MSVSTAARRRLLRSMLREQSVTGQQELVDLLGAAGHPVTQATVSRDLRSIGATKNRDGAYEVPDRTPGWNDDVLSRVIAGFVEEIAVSGNIVVLKTPPGAAQMVASAIDTSALDHVIGTVAGDDTVLAVTAGPGRRVAAALERIGAP